MHTDWQPIPRPAEQAEFRLVEAILTGVFAINTSLPPERQLAQRLGVTRPTLREALQRLSRENWIEIHQGKPTRVRDFWKEGNLQLLATLAQHPAHVPPGFVAHLLDIRLFLAPHYTVLALQQAPQQVTAVLETLGEVEDTAPAYAAADLHLHTTLTILSGNPVLVFIFNGFTELYRQLSQRYFALPQHRRHSQAFYQALLACARSADLAGAQTLTARVMAESLQNWRSLETPQG